MGSHPVRTSSLACRYLLRIGGIPFAPTGKICQNSILPSSVLVWQPRDVGHNPAAALMIMALLALLVACGATGWMLGLGVFWDAEWVKDQHQACAYAILVLAAIHALAAIVEREQHGDNLILSLITGRQRAPGGTDIDHASTFD